MASQFNIEDQFTCSAEALYELSISDAFDDALMAHLGLGKEQLERVERPEGPRLKLRVTSHQDVPAIAKKFVGDRLSYIEERRWDKASLSNTWTIEPELSTVKAVVEGSLTLVPNDKGCLRRITGSINLKIPLIGKSIEEMVIKSIREDFVKNAKFCAQYIQEQHIES